RASLRASIENGTPCYAECGGLLYFGGHLVFRGGAEDAMVGAVAGGGVMTGRLQDFGFFGGQTDGEGFYGHEFHYSRWRQEGDLANLWRVCRKRTGQERIEGFTMQRLRASYIHLDYRQSRNLILPWLRLEPEAAMPEFEEALV